MSYKCYEIIKCTIIEIKLNVFETPHEAPFDYPHDYLESICKKVQQNLLYCKLILLI